MKSLILVLSTLKSGIRLAAICWLLCYQSQIALAQPAASASLFAQLDALLASGEGRGSSRPRPPLPPAVEADLQQSPDTEKSELFQPKSRDQAAAESNAKFAQAVQNIQEKNAARLAELTQKII